MQRQVLPFISMEDYENKDLPNYVHDNARELAMEIFNHFVRGTRIVVLRAQMQCGKTSVIRHLYYLLNYDVDDNVTDEMPMQ